MRLLLSIVIVLSTIAAEAVAVAVPLPKSSATAATKFVGRWRVKFIPRGGSERNLVFTARANGTGSFQLLDNGPDDKPVAALQPAAWSQLTNDRVSFSGEVELPIGTCCREIGTLIFKGKFVSRDSIAGKLIFVTSVEEEENPYGLRSLVGTFTAVRLPHT